MDHKINRYTDKRNDLLKIIAMVTMLIDHIGIMFYPDITLFRTIGRIAFPIFAYYIAVGFYRTSNRLRYFLRILAFALFTQYPYSFYNTDLIRNNFHFNILFLFAYAFIMLYVYEQIRVKWQEKHKLISLLLIPLLILIIAVPEILTVVFEGFNVSYRSYGLMMILLFYILRNKPIHLIIAYIALSFFGTYLTGVRYLNQYDINWLGGSYSYFSCFIMFDKVMPRIITTQNGLTSLDGYFFQARSILGLITIMVFSRFSIEIKMNKYIPYIFFPAHLIILLIIRVLIGSPL